MNSRQRLAYRKAWRQRIHWARRLPWPLIDNQDIHIDHDWISDIIAYERKAHRAEAMRDRAFEFARRRRDGF